MRPVPSRCLADASVVAKWLVDEDEEDLEGARRVLEAARDRASDVFVLDLTFYEVGNALCRRLRSRSQAIVPLLLAMFDLDVGVMGLSDVVAASAGALAVSHGLSFYDAAYLAAAEATEATLVTSDRKLLRAAGPRGIAAADLA